MRERLLHTVEVCGAEPGSIPSPRPRFTSRDRGRVTGASGVRHGPLTKGTHPMSAPQAPTARRARPADKPAPRHAARWLAAAAAGLLALTALPSPAAAATTTTAKPSAVAATAAGWLAGQLDGGTHLVTSGYPDYGLTADAILALDAAQTAQTAATAATSWFAANIASYVGDGTKESYAGSLAKSLLVAEAQQPARTSLGGVDLLTRLQAREQGPTGASPGRFSDASAYGDYSNTFGQALALIALHRAGAGPDAAAIASLVSQQCPDGGFRLDYPSGSPSTACTSDPDATALAVQALLDIGQTAPAGRGLDYLAAAQTATGGLANAAPSSTVNANTTGLAAVAFQAGGRTSNYDAALGYLTGLQQGCDTPPAQQGAIAYDGSTFSASTSARATTQAILGLTGATLAGITAGGSATAPSLGCPTPTPTPTPSTSSTRTAASAGATSGTAATLPKTGATTAPLTLVGLVLLLTGAGLLGLVRPGGLNGASGGGATGAGPRGGRRRRGAPPR